MNMCLRRPVPKGQRSIFRTFCDHEFCFIHIRRTGGTSMCSAMGMSNSHFTAHSLIKAFGMKQFRKMFSFTFVRDPWDRIMSLYLWTTRKDKIRPSFWVWLRTCNTSLKIFKQQWESLIWHSDIVVQKVFKFEEIEAGWVELRKRFPFFKSLPHLNPTKCARSYREFYTDRERKKVGKLYRRDIAMFNYKF